ncbi:MAG: DNA gyrase subunit A [Patescibacteria group bacterium]
MKHAPPPPPPSIGTVQPRPIVEEMQTSYLDYAMSVIVARALPDVRDGLKPVHRKILYAMWDMGLTAGAKFRKSATVVGEVLGKYHPHGDIAVYDALVRMAQDFAMRYPLIRGQGNFGSMDGDTAAAMRYTEVKLTPIAEELLFDLEKDTVNFVPNYDSTQREPAVLPGKLPNLLLNGTVGIAVGMATNIPPHNVRELTQAIIHLIDHPQASVADLVEFIHGPDFPTGGTIYNRKAITEAYATGKGAIVMRGKAEIMEGESGDYHIVITEIPYQVNKAQLIETIATLVKEKKIEGIKDLRDESSHEGVRMVVELKKDAFPKKVLNQLFDATQLQDTFHVNLLALEEGLQPKVMTLKGILEEHITHRQEVIKRRSTFDLRKAKERAHILEGLILATAKIDAVIKTIKQSKDRGEAKQNLIKKFHLTDRQAEAILEMKLSQLANLERLKIETELKEKKRLIADLTDLLAHPKKMLQVIKNELTQIAEKYGDDRRTQVVARAVDTFTTEDLIPDEPAVIVVTRDGYLKRLSPETFRTQGRGGKGVIGLVTKEEDAVEHLFATTTHANILFFTSRGRVFQLKAYDVPQTSRTAKGQAVQNFLELAPGERVTSVLPVANLKSHSFLVMVTKNGIIKKTELQDFESVRRSGLIAIKLKAGDQLEWVKPSTGRDELILATRGGQTIRFPESQVRPMGRNASGVRGVKLKGKDEVVGIDVIAKATAASGSFLTILSNGFGKLTSLKDYRAQRRGGSGVKTAKVTTKTGEIVAGFIYDPRHATEDAAHDVIMISQKGQVIRLPLKSVPSLGRATQGVKLMRFKDANDKVASVTLV